MASALLLMGLGLLCFGFLFQVVESSGQIEIKLIRFQCSCTDNWILKTECDTYFILCIDKQRTPSSSRCHYKRRVTGHYHDTNTMDFGSVIQGQPNPIVNFTSSFPTGGVSDVMFVLEARDHDTGGRSDLIGVLSKNISYTPRASEALATWSNAYQYSGSTHMWFAYRFYCHAYYYTPKCDVYCKARDDDLGHYTCIDGTGQKKCMRGWTGENCDQDINECGLGPCYHHANCTNTPGSYQCSCPQGYAGQNCDLIDSLCHSAPCKNGGTCEGTMQNYTCTCPFEWKGKNCQTQVDFCESNPCQNNATCYATLGNYTCACAPGFAGYHCTTEVNACDSAPCENGGSCSKRPAAQYECACPAQYEGESCQTLKNPCDPNPCLNSGTCDTLNYDTFNCTCVFGWQGTNCSQFLNTSSPQEQQGADGGDGDEGIVHWLPIVLAIISAIIIVLCILILLYLRRRRRQKKALEAANRALGGQGDLVHVAGTDNLAFRNALYDQTNRTNSVLEARGERPPLPTPTPPCLPDDAFNFTKPKMMDEELGAVGGCNPYQDIDGYETPAKCVEMNGAVGGKVDSNPLARTAALDTRTVAGGGNPYDNPREPATNPYADFEDLRRRSVAVKDTSGYANTQDPLERMEEAEENHYQDLDDVRLDMQPLDPQHTPSPALPAASHYDNPRSFFPNAAPTGNDATPAGHVATPTGNDATPAGHDAVPTGNDATPAGNDVTAMGYMQMNGSAPRNLQLERLDSSDEEEEGVMQEDIDWLRQEVLQRSANQSKA